MMTRSEFVWAWKRNPLSKTHCFYCGREFKKGMGSTRSILRETVEHIIPQHAYKGGPQLANNTVGACAGCNNGKNGDTPYDFRLWFGKSFFCEIQLGQDYPVDDNSIKGDGSSRLYYGGLFVTWNKQQQNLFENNFFGPRLNSFLRKVIQEARCKTKKD